MQFLDFTLSKYNLIIDTFLDQGYSVLKIEEMLSISSFRKAVILRHDVDLFPENSLKSARILAQKGINGIFFFRIKKSYNEKIIKEIFSIGHEIGYHYEDFSIAAEEQNIKIKRSNRKRFGEYEMQLANIAIEIFATNLEKMRKIVPVKIICMHGNPLSRWDSRLLWKYYNYKDFGITCEPYFDLNFSDMLYLTDTGRRWNGKSVSIRDKAMSIESKIQLSDEGINKIDLSTEEYKNWTVKPIKGSLINMTKESAVFQKRFRYHTTNDIIKALNTVQFPEKIMINFHPQRWTERPIPWLREYTLQNIKNTGKFFWIKINNSRIYNKN